MSAPDERDLREQLTPAVVLAEPDALELLTRGELTIEGRLVDASNATLYCAATLDGVTGACVYKPESGERPLWDFPDGTLACRETAAYTVSRSSGWGIVPPTVRREDGPFGPGMVQLWIDVPDEIDLRAVLRGWRTQLQQLVVFDALINNADRKGGHLLPTADGHLYAVDHGVSFHVEEKLRTILWNWAGEKLPGDCADAVRRDGRRVGGRARRAADFWRGPGHPPSAGPAHRQRPVPGTKRRLAGHALAALVSCLRA
jgi:hypothetical protein